MIAGRLLRLLCFSPRALAQYARSIRPGPAVLVGWPAAALALGLPFGTLFMGMGEPYRTVDQYLHQWWALFFGVWVMAIPTGLAVLFLVGNVRGASSPLEAARGTVVMLGAVPFVLPAGAWSVVRIFARLADPSLTILAGHPAWMTSPVVRVLGSGWWLLAALVGWLWLMSRAFGIIRAHEPDRARRWCRECGYALNGAAGTVCPECGVSAPSPVGDGS